MQLYTRKQRQEGHYTLAEGSMHDKLQDKYHDLFLNTAKPIVKELYGSFGTVEAKRLMSIIFEVFLDKEAVIITHISLYHTTIKQQ